MTPSVVRVAHSPGEYSARGTLRAYERRDDLRLTQFLERPLEADVIWSEVMPPLRNAMRLVHRKQRDRQWRKGADELFGGLRALQHDQPGVRAKLSDALREGCE